jgi:mRNA interferase MazF
MIEGSIALTSLPQADNRLKPRPVILLRRMPPFGDWLVCGVSTQIHQQAPSLIRLGFIAVLPESRLLGLLGAISPDRHRRLLQRLSAFLGS